MEVNGYKIEMGADLRGADPGAFLGFHPQIDLTGVELVGLDLLPTDLTGAYLPRANLFMEKLVGTDLTGATMPDGSIHD